MHIDSAMGHGFAPVSVITLCAVSLATLPLVVAHRPDAVVVWIDAHGDLHDPGSTSSGYLTGMALSGALGWWDSGLGSGLQESQTILVGAHELSPPEVRRLDGSRLISVPCGTSIADRLRSAIAGRPVYVHVDCDVLGSGMVGAQGPALGGLSLEQLKQLADACADSEVIGVELAGYEGPGVTDPALLIEALSPIFG